MTIISHPYHVEISKGRQVEQRKFDRMPEAVRFSMDRFQDATVTRVTIYLCNNGHQTWIWSRDKKKKQARV